jgi:Gpi18-like mannosyltransferase
MGRFDKIHWILFCTMVFLVSRLIMLYQYNLANEILSQNHSDFFLAMCKWDCKWYITIIKDGYDLVPRHTPKIWKGLANWAFFPLYPYIVKFIVSITSLSVVMAGVLLNQLFIFLALLVFYKYLRLFVDDLNSRFGVILLSFSPFSVYFASLYTEALFLLLSLSAFYFMRINRPIISAICGGLLSATRPVGVMFSVSYLLYHFFKKKIGLKILIGCFITGVGLLLYMVYLQYHVGDYLAFQHIQKGWGRHGFDTKHIFRQIWLMLSDTHNSILFLISCALSVYLIVKKFYEEAVFNLLCILPGVATGTMMSEGRFCGTLFTLYFAITIMSRKSVSLKISMALVFILFYISYFLYWLAHAKFLI